MIKIILLISIVILGIVVVAGCGRQAAGQGDGSFVLHGEDKGDG